MSHNLSQVSHLAPNVITERVCVESVKKIGIVPPAIYVHQRPSPVIKSIINVCVQVGGLPWVIITISETHTVAI